MRKLFIIIIMLLASMIVFGAEEVDMRKPVIDPGIWYQMQVNDGLRGVFISIAIFATIALIIIGVSFIVCSSDGNYTWENNHVKILIFCSIILFCIMLIITGCLVGIYVPSSDTMIKMAVTEQITPANIDGVKQDIKGVIDYIIEKVKELK